MCCKTIETIFLLPDQTQSFRVYYYPSYYTSNTQNAFGNEVLGSSRAALFLENWQMVILSIETSTDSSFYVFRALVTTTPLTILSTTIRKSHDKCSFPLGRRNDFPFSYLPPFLYTYVYPRNISRTVSSITLSFYILYVRVVCGVYISYVYAIHVTGRRPCPYRDGVQ